MGYLSEEWIQQAERLHQRYLIGIVEACGLCPWAERARRDGRTRTTVLLEPGDADVDRALRTMETWGADARVEIGFLVFPRLELARAEFDRFVARLRALETDRHPLGRAPFAFAAFHPHGEADLTDPERLIPFLRRTPDPCIQLVRMATLKRVRAGTLEGTQFVDIASLEAALSQTATPPLRERIARTNLETVRTMGLTQLRARIVAIQEDRARTYEALEARMRSVAEFDHEQVVGDR